MIYTAETSVDYPHDICQMSAEHPKVHPMLTRARDSRIGDRDRVGYVETLHDGIEYPYLLEELKERYQVAFVRTPVNERCVFCNAKYLGDAEVKLCDDGYAVRNHVWLVDFYRANEQDYSVPVTGLLTIWCRKWRNVGLGEPRTAFAGLCAVTADKRRSIVTVECNLEARL